MTATETPNAVETLREAAKVMRDRADAASLATGDAPWHFTGMNYCIDRSASTYSVWSSSAPHAPDPDAVFVCDAATEEQALHIAAMNPGVVAAVQEPRWPGEDRAVPPALRIDCDCERPCEHTTAAARRYVGITGVEREAYERSLRPAVDEPTDEETARIHAAVRDYEDAGADRLLRALGEEGQR